MRDQSNRLLLVDLDGTLLRGNSLPVFLINVLGWWKLILGLPLLFLGWIGVVIRCGIQSGKLKESLLCHYFKGQHRATMEAFGEKCALGKLIFMLNPLVEQTLKEAQMNGETVVLVTASLDIWVKPLARYMGMMVLCTEVEYDSQDLFTGRFATPNCKYGEKKRRILEKFDVEKYDRIVAFGNSKGDAAMFKLADEVWWVESDGRLICLKTAE